MSSVAPPAGDGGTGGTVQPEQPEPDTEQPEPENEPENAVVGERPFDTLVMVGPSAAGKSTLQRYLARNFGMGTGR